jgi:RNA:NAD 2'-phosphotransferase (TPT1/KptA family)
MAARRAGTLISLGDLPGHEFHGNQWTGAIFTPSFTPKSDEDRALLADPMARVPMRLYRGTERGDFESTARFFPRGELGGGIYFTKDYWLARTYGGGGDASFEGGTRAVHEVEWARKPEPYEVAFMQGVGDKTRTNWDSPTESRVVTGEGKEIWRGSWPGDFSSPSMVAPQAARSEMLAAIKTAGIKVTVGLESSFGANQIAVLDKSLLKHRQTLVLPRNDTPHFEKGTITDRYRVKSTAPAQPRSPSSRLLGDFPGHEFHGNQYTLGQKLDELKLPKHTAPSNFGFASQVGQFPAKGKPGIGYFKGKVPGGHVDALLHRDPKGKLVGVLYHYPQDLPPYEQKGNINVLVDPAHQRQGIASGLLREADKRWDINLQQQSWTSEGKAFIEGVRRKKRSLESRSLGDLPGHEFHGNQWTVYHGTAGERLDSILKNGIGPRPHLRKLGSQPGRAVYVTTDFDHARYYAETTGKRKHPVILEIHVPKSRAQQFKQESEEVYKSNRTIPPSWIKAVRDPFGKKIRMAAEGEGTYEVFYVVIELTPEDDEFHGNQWTSGSGAERIDMMSPIPRLMKPDSYASGFLQMYHVTSLDSAKAIDKEGFKKDFPNQFQGFESAHAGVYGWASLDRARLEVQRMEETSPGAKSDMAIVQFQVPRSAWDRLRADEDTGGEGITWQKSYKEAMSVVLLGDVSPKWIKGHYVDRSIRALGDVPGHPFHGNQYTDGIGGDGDGETVTVYHNSPDVLPGDKPSFGAYFGDKEFTQAFKNEWGEHTYAVKLAKKDVLDLGSDSQTARAFQASVARQAYPNDPDTPAFTKRLEHGDPTAQDDFYEAWTDKRYLDTVLRKYPFSNYKAVHFRGEYYVPAKTLAQLKGEKIKALGDVPGHPFHGNQWTDGQGGTKEDFHAVADYQRGKPEAAMLRAQEVLGGGVMQVAVEHIGDLTHRMTERNTFNSGGYEFVKEKVARMERSLNNPYGFEREFAGNIKSNAEYRGVSVDVLTTRVREVLNAYADAHEKVPVLNRAQRVARDTAVALGRQDFDKVRRGLTELRAHLGSREEWVAFAHEGLVEQKALGDLPGHPFHGNQYTDGVGGTATDKPAADKPAAIAKSEARQKVDAFIESKGYKTLGYDQLPEELKKSSVEEGIVFKEPTMALPQPVLEGVAEGLDGVQALGLDMKSNVAVVYADYTTPDGPPAATAVLSPHGAFMMINANGRALEALGKDENLDFTVAGREAKRLGLTGEARQRSMFRDVVIHESGHFADGLTNGNLTNVTVDSLILTIPHATEDAVIPKWLEKNLSGYSAAGGPNEAGAELWTAAVRDYPVPKELQAAKEIMRSAIARKGKP